jgi:hypothetical protein
MACLFWTSGEGAAPPCIAELLAAAIAHQTGTTVLEARQNIWLVDSKGLVTRSRWGQHRAGKVTLGIALELSACALVDQDILHLGSWCTRCNMQPLWVAGILVGSLYCQGAKPLYLTGALCQIGAHSL